jgi:hypothetical protein
MNNTEICSKVMGHRESYYLRWYHEKPIFVTTKRRDEIRKLHEVLYKAIEYMGIHYKEYVDTYMPLDSKIMEILDYQSQFPYRAGTYRPDYIVTEDGELKLCEITSRFFAHGIFSSYFAECDANRFMAKYPGHTREVRFEEMISYMRKLVDGYDEIYVLKSSDRTNEIPLYEAYYAYIGKKVHILEAEEVESNIENWKGKMIFSALNQHDLLGFSIDTLKTMMDSKMINDFRTTFLVHDKRFMRLWFEDVFTSNFLTEEETEFLRSHSIETYICKEKPSILQDAYTNKDQYILKHYCLGKSEKVYAGLLTDNAAWQFLFDSGQIEDMILQPFIKQRVYPTVWEGQAFDDYICGMMLCVNDQFFDNGLVRTSSLPVTNVGDDRKACMIMTDDPFLLSKGDVL